MLNVKDATLSKARKQDAELDRAFEAFVGENQRDLYKYCYMLTGCQHDAEDLAQETWLKVYTAFGHVRQAVESKAYLRKIALNRWVDQLRKRRIPSTAMEEVQDAPVLESDSLVLKSLLAKEALAELAQTLPPRQQAAVLLTEVFGHTAREAAELLSTSEGAVKALLTRARTTLAKRRRTETSESGASQVGVSQMGVRQNRDRPLDKDDDQRPNVQHHHPESAESDWVDGIYRAVLEGDVETVLELTGQSGDTTNSILCLVA